MGADSGTPRRRLGLIGGAGLFVVLLLVPAPDGLDPTAWGTAAVGLLLAVWTNPRSIIVGSLLASALLSMWVSSTATALMVLPIGASMINLDRNQCSPSRDTSSPSTPST